MLLLLTDDQDQKNNQNVLALGKSPIYQYSCVLTSADFFRLIQSTMKSKSKPVF